MIDMDIAFAVFRVLRRELPGQVGMTSGSSVIDTETISFQWECRDKLDSLMRREITLPNNIELTDAETCGTELADRFITTAMKMGYVLQ